MTRKERDPSKRYLVASDFDQTLSFNDSGILLSELLGITGFEGKVSGLAGQNLVQQGAELSYLILHDPEFRQVRREHLAEAGRRVRLKKNVDRLIAFLKRPLEGRRFHFYVVSAAERWWKRRWRASFLQRIFSGHNSVTGRTERWNRSTIRPVTERWRFSTVSTKS